MPWAGNKCSILATTLPPDVPSTKGGQGEGEVLPVTDEGEEVREAKMVFIPDDEPKEGV